MILLPQDKMLIIPTENVELGTDSKGKEITVEDFYSKASKNEVSSDDMIYGFNYSLSKIGDSQDHYAFPTNSVNFEDGFIKVNYKNGGV